MKVRIRSPFAPTGRQPKEGESYSPPLEIGDRWINTNTNSVWVWNGRYWKYLLEDNTM